VVVGVIVVAYTFSVTFLSSAEIPDQLMDIQILSSPQDGSLEIPADGSPESSGIRRSPGSQSGPARTPPAPAEVRTPGSRLRPDAQRSEGTSRSPNISAGQPPAGRRTSRTLPSRPGSPTTRQPAQPGAGFVVTPSQGVDREKRSAPQRSPSSPPIRGSLD